MSSFHPEPLDELPTAALRRLVSELRAEVARLAAEAARLQINLGRVPLAVKTQLETRMTAREVLALRPGDVVAMPQSASAFHHRSGCMFSIQLSSRAPRRQASSMASATLRSRSRAASGRRCIPTCSGGAVNLRSD